MYCRQCGAQIGAGYECPNCKTHAGDGNNYCPNCGNKVAVWASRCNRCGISFISEETAAARDLNGHSKLGMALLAFFLGGLGIHCFVMGEAKKGMFRIILSLACGLGAWVALIDMILIIIGRYEVDSDKYLW